MSSRSHLSNMPPTLSKFLTFDLVCCCEGCERRVDRNLDYFRHNSSTLHHAHKLVLAHPDKLKQGWEEYVAERGKRRKRGQKAKPRPLHVCNSLSPDHQLIRAFIQTIQTCQEDDSMMSHNQVAIVLRTTSAIARRHRLLLHHLVLFHFLPSPDLRLLHHLQHHPFHSLMPLSVTLSGPPHKIFVNFQLIIAAVNFS